MTLQIDPAVTSLLQEIEAGNSDATEQLFDLLYRELRSIASSRLAAEASGQTLQATALVHEAYLRLVGSDRPMEHQWRSREHFVSVAARTMRRILIDRARVRSAVKRGGGRGRRQVDPATIALDSPPEDLLALDGALSALEAIDRQKAELVRLRFFAGLTLGEASQVLGMSRSTADRAWRYAKSWLYDRLKNCPDS